MFVIYDENMMKPIKLWLPDETHLEPGCMEQARQLANLPFIFQWAALMPDAHQGNGMPIGGVVATEDVVIPNAVGVDIGCGMAFVSTNLRWEEIAGVQTGNGSFTQAVVSDIMRSIPVGFGRHKEKQTSAVLDAAQESLDLYEATPELLPNLDAGRYQIGTLGGGNHFIELQTDDDGYVCVMLHSGSRNFGLQVCRHFNDAAKSLNQKWRSALPEGASLYFLPTDSQEGRQYIRWMNLALDFARENRAKMMAAVKACLTRRVQKYAKTAISYGDEINCHHNYAALEHHYGKNVWVHRKGATRARKGERAVIPGAMGSYSYVVEGLGNPLSFCSSSHGAGRAYSRKAAMQAFSCESVMLDLKEQGVALGKQNKSDVAEECRFAYKDIDFVMNNQTDLVAPVKRLKTVGVVKG